MSTEEVLGDDSSDVESEESNPTAEDVVAELTPEQEEFNRKRDTIAEKLQADDKTFYKTIAEIYIFMNNLDTAIRGIAQMGGPKAMLKILMGREKGD